jgi:hypothetical protein
MNWMLSYHRQQEARSNPHDQLAAHLVPVFASKGIVAMLVFFSFNGLELRQPGVGCGRRSSCDGGTIMVQLRDVLLTVAAGYDRARDTTFRLPSSSSIPFKYWVLG